MKSAARGILVTVRSDSTVAIYSYLPDEGMGDYATKSLMASIFVVVRTLCGLCSDFPFNTEPVALNFATHSNMVVV